MGNGVNWVDVQLRNAYPCFEVSILDALLAVVEWRHGAQCYFSAFSRYREAVSVCYYCKSKSVEIKMGIDRACFRVRLDGCVLQGPESGVEPARGQQLGVGSPRQDAPGPQHEDGVHLLHPHQAMGDEQHAAAGH